MFTVIRIGLMFVAFLALAAISSRRPWKRGKFVGLSKGGVDVKIGRGKYNSLQGATVSLDLPGTLNFSLQREYFFDRLAKYIGLSREWEGVDAEFDRRIYITCDDKLLQETLYGDGQLREALRRLLMAQPRSLWCSHGRLRIECGKEGEDRSASDEELRTTFARKLGDDLQIVRERLLPLASSGHDKSRDATIAPRNLISVFAASCAVLGIAGGFYGDMKGDTQVVHANLVHLSNMVTAVTALALLGLFASRIAGTSSAQRSLADIAFMALPGIWLLSFGALTAYNQLGDTGAATRYAVHVDNAYKTKAKNHWNYHLEVREWPDPRGDRKVKIRESTFGILTPGGCVDVLWRRGRLGDGWIEGFQPNNTNQCEGAFVE